MLLVATIGSGLCLHFAACHCAAAAAVVMSRLSLATFGACCCCCGPAAYRLLQPAYVYVVGLARHTFAYWPWGLVAACPCLSTATRPGYLGYAVNCMHVGEHACGLVCSVSFVNGLPAVCIRCVSLLCCYYWLVLTS